MHNNPNQALQLESAFAAFNKASQHVADRYSELEKKVVELTEQLDRANDERLQQLAEKEMLADRLSGIVSALPGGLMVISSSGVLLEWNTKAEQLLGICLSGKTWQQVNESCFSKGVLQAGEVVLSNGRRVTLSVQMLNSADGKVILINDVTEISELQESLQHRERLLLTGEMVGKLAHQIRTPLASAFLYLSRFKGLKTISSKSGDAYQNLHGCLSTLQQTVDGLLHYIRKQNPAMEYIFIQNLINSISVSFKAEVENNAVETEFVDLTNNKNIYINRSALEGALINLLTNAVQAGATGVRLGFALDEHDILITVEDNGPGISEAASQHLFKPFYTTKTDGTGLGLAIVRTVMELHGGTVEIDQGCNIGACFKVKLPLSSEPHLLSSQTRSEKESDSYLYN